MRVPAKARPRVKAGRVWTSLVSGKDFTKAKWKVRVAQAEGGAWKLALPAAIKAAKTGRAAFIAELELLDSAGETFLIHAPVQVWELGRPANK